MAHLPRLDGVRGLAILLVLLYHFVHDALPDALIEHRATALLSFGWAGVDLFFVLSGFLITGLLVDDRGSPRYFRTFYGRRVLRILPLYVTFLLAYTLTLTIFGPPDDLELLARSAPFLGTFTTNIAVASAGTFLILPPYLGILWSLAVEEQFYLLWPILILLTPTRHVVPVCIGLAALALVIRVALVSTGAPWIAVYVLTPSRMDTLALGGAVAVLYREGRLATLAPLAQPVALGCLATLAALSLAGASFDSGTPILPTFGYTLIALLWTAGLVSVLTHHRSAWTVLTDQPWLQGLGTYAYGLYLWQAVWLLALDRWQWMPWAFVNDGLSPWLAVGLYASLGVALTLLSAVASWHLFERPLNALKRHLPYQRAAARGSIKAGQPSPSFL